MKTAISRSQFLAEQLIAQTQRWIQSVVIGAQFCPFAGQVFEAQSIHYQIVEQNRLEACLQALISECWRLDKTREIETTLILYPFGYAVFEDFLELLELAEALLVEQGYEGIYQLASFHPDYQFAGEPSDDPANYTNRSPYPMLHLLREASLDKVLLDCPDSSQIPERNIHHARALGEQALKALLEHCLKSD